MHTTPVTAQTTASGKPGFSTTFPFRGFTGELPPLTLTHEKEEPWKLVDDFRESKPDDRHAVLDWVTGRLFFGPLISYGIGNTRQYGAVPPPGALIKLAATEQRPLARTRGSAGNTAARTIIHPPLDLAISVTNEHAATGGTDGISETPDPGARHEVTLLVLPAPPPHPTGRPSLIPTEQLTTALSTALRPALPPNTDVNILPFDFTGLGIRAAVHTDTPLTDSQREHLAHTAEQALSDWFNPLTGGRDGTGWPLGRTVTAGETRTVLDHVPGITYTLGLELCEVAPDGTWLAPAETLRLPPLGLVHCAEHKVAVLPGTLAAPTAPLDTIVRGTRSDQWVGVRSKAATVYSLTSRQALPPNEHPRALIQKVTTPPAGFTGFDALITLPENRLLAFRGTLTACTSLDLDAPWEKPRPIKDAFPNLPKEFHEGINTGFAKGDTLCLFLADSYAQCPAPTSPPSSTTPNRIPPRQGRITDYYRDLPSYFTRQLDAVIVGKLTGEQYLISGKRYALTRDEVFVTQGSLAETFPGL
ncbi:hypothetical protein ACR820_05565 [Streptomyces netropsis]